MGNLVITPAWQDVPYFEENAILTGGPDCPDNIPIQALANRDAYLKQQGDSHTAAADPHAQYWNDPRGNAKIAEVAQTQLYTAFTTTGATGAFVLTPSPAIAAYAANQRFRVKFHAVGSGSDTINVSGFGEKSIKQYDRAGAKVSAVITANQLTDVEYDGVDFVILDPLPSVGGQQIFTDNGSFTVPAGVSRLFVSLVGGGGGGAGAISGAPYTPGGGGAGGVQYRVPLSVTPNQTVAVTIGQGGGRGIGTNQGGSYANSNGASGGASSFGGLLTVSGGGGGVCQAYDSNGGSPGTTQYSGWGGNGSNEPATRPDGGAGGGNIFSASAPTGHGPTPANLYGGGGGGGRAGVHLTNGAAGAAGLCIVEW